MKRAGSGGEAKREEEPQVAGGEESGAQRGVDGEVRVERVCEALRDGGETTGTLEVRGVGW